MVDKQVEFLKTNFKQSTPDSILLKRTKKMYNNFSSKHFSFPLPVSLSMNLYSLYLRFIKTLTEWY